MQNPAGQGGAAKGGYAGRQHAYTAPQRRNQVLTDDGHRLPPRRHQPNIGAPRRSVPGWYALAADGWSDVAR